MSIDLAYDETQQVFGDTLRQFCAARCTDEVLRRAAGALPEGLWPELADLGALAIGTAEGEGGALEMAAAMEALGAAAFPGPLVATALAGQLLEHDELRAVTQGRVLVAAGVPPLLPFAPIAGIFLERAGDRVFRADAAGSVTPVETLGGEPWGRVELSRRSELAGGPRALVFADTGFAAYLAAAGDRLVRDASEHARSRRQFGRAIGEFQAVAHPLADCCMQLAAATTLARAAAFHLDGGDLARARSTASAARLSACRSALEAAHVCHQVFGAIGITLEGPVFHLSRRIRQLASAPGSDTAREDVLHSFMTRGAA